MPYLPFSTRFSVALVAVGDPSRDRTVYATIVLLVALGFTMIMLAVWLLRNTRPDPEVLAPLERMGERRWRRADPVWQRRHLDEVRPGGADPLEPTSAPPATDAEFERGPQPIGFDDLKASSTTSVAAASGLPAPSAEVRPVDEPLDADGCDGLASAGRDAIASAPEAAANVAAGSVDDEDITGEQDTDEFLAVLDQVSELEPDGDPLVEPDVDPVVEPDGDPVVEPDVDPVVEPESAAEVEDGSEVQTDAEPESDGEPEGDHKTEPDVEPDDDDDDDDKAG